MKVLPKKGMHEGVPMELLYRIKGTRVFRAKHSKGNRFVRCYLHDNELSGFDRIILRQTLWSRICTKSFVKFNFFVDDLKSALRLIKKLF